MDGLNLLAAFARGLSGFQQQEVRVAQDGRQRVVDARTHVEHVAPQRCVTLRRERQPFGALRPTKRFDAPQRFNRNQDQRSRPAILPGNNQQMRVLGVKRGEYSFPLRQNRSLPRGARNLPRRESKRDFRRGQAR